MQPQGGHGQSVCPVPVLNRASHPSSRPLLSSAKHPALRPDTTKRTFQIISALKELSAQPRTETTFNVNPAFLTPLQYQKHQRDSGPPSCNTVLVLHPATRPAEPSRPFCGGSPFSSSSSSSCCELSLLSLKTWELLSSLASPHPSPGSVSRELS